MPCKVWQKSEENDRWNNNLFLVERLEKEQIDEFSNKNPLQARQVALLCLFSEFLLGLGSHLYGCGRNFLLHAYINNNNNNNNNDAYYIYNIYVAIQMEPYDWTQQHRRALVAGPSPTRRILGALGYVVHTYGLLIFRFYYRPRMVPNAVYERKMVITVVARDIHKQDTSRVCACVTREKHATFRSFQTNTRRCFALEHVSACTVEPWKKVSLYMYCKAPFDTAHPKRLHRWSQSRWSQKNWLFSASSSF